MAQRIWPQKVFAVLFHLTLGLMMLDWACPLPSIIGDFGLYECCFILLAVAFVLCMPRDGKTFFSDLLQWLRRSPWLTVSVLLYTVWGLICALRGPDVSFAMIRYRVTGQMLLFSLFLCYYLWSNRLERQLKRVAANLSVTACGIALIAMIGYFTDRYTYYFQRISPIKDYNQYATLLLMGLAAGVLLVYHVKRPLWQKLVALLPMCVVLSSAIYLAGSRRSDVLLCVFGCVLSVYGIYRVCRRHVNNPQPRRLVACIAGIVAVALLSVGCANGLHIVTGSVCKLRIQAVRELENSQQELDDSTRQRLDLLKDQDNLEDAISDIATGDGFARRTVIWNIAKDRIQASSAKEWILGQGASASWDLYDDLTDPGVCNLRAKYPYMTDELTHWMNPHNLFLQDMIEGGLVQILLLLSVLASIGVGVIRLLFRWDYCGVGLVLMYCVLFVTLLLSSSKGMCAHKYFWLLITWQIVQMSRLPKKGDRS